MTKATAQSLKEEGNRHFQQGDYHGAEALYSKAIIADPSEPTLYTNRAFARLKLGLYESVMGDCDDCLRLAPGNMKAHYYLAQAHLALRSYDEALQHAQQAHAICARTGDKSLGAVTTQVLRCRKERWDDRERRRRREGQDLEAELVTVMERERNAALADAMDLDDGGKREVGAEWDRKIEDLRRVFQRARAAEDRRRKVPDWAIDDISFGFMVDPVVTKSGKSYERASIVEHLKRSKTDPLTREPLDISDLRPNVELKQACDEFLEENGWAADW